MKGVVVKKLVGVARVHPCPERPGGMVFRLDPPARRTKFVCLAWGALWTCDARGSLQNGKRMLFVATGDAEDALAQLGYRLVDEITEAVLDEIAKERAR